MKKFSKFKNYYGVLGVSHTATYEEIKVAFRENIKKLHPDIYSTLNEKLKATAKTQDLNQAYEVLSNLQKRIEYDREYKMEMASWDIPAPPPSHEGKNDIKKTPNSFFEKFFLFIGAVVFLIAFFASAESFGITRLNSQSIFENIISGVTILIGSIFLAAFSVLMIFASFATVAMLTYGYFDALILQPFLKGWTSGKNIFPPLISEIKATIVGFFISFSLVGLGVYLVNLTKMESNFVSGLFLFIGVCLVTFCGFATWFFMFYFLGIAVYYIWSKRVLSQSNALLKIE